MIQRMLRLIVLFTLLFVPIQLSAQNPSAQIKLDGFDTFVEQVMKDWKVPGLSLAIVKDGKIVYAKGYGYRDVVKKLPVTPDTLFAIGSNSKSFTAAALGILADEGKLDWDKPVREYMPDFRLYDEYATANLRVRDLVSHQSGLPRHDLLWYGSPLSRKELFDHLRYLEPNRKLHEKYQYNNLMFMTAGFLVERLSGQTWEEFVSKRIFQ
ncbi:MAG: serine hydrolase domain-containing protein, partial [Blastocatellia bacterium]